MAYSPQLWEEAKKKCRLGDEEIRMAKEMGLNPKNLIKNIPNKNEQWKVIISFRMKLRFGSRIIFLVVY